MIMFMSVMVIFMLQILFLIMYIMCIVFIIYNFKSDVNAKDANEATPLHYASRYKQRMFTTATGDVVKVGAIIFV